MALVLLNSLLSALLRLLNKAVPFVIVGIARITKERVEHLIVLLVFLEIADEKEGCLDDSEAKSTEAGRELCKVSAIPSQALHLRVHVQHYYSGEKIFILCERFLLLQIQFYCAQMLLI